MDNSACFKRHFSALSLLFLLCNSILILPANCSARYLPLCVSAAFAVGFIIYFILVFALSRLSREENLISKIFLILVLLFAAVAGLFFAAETLSVFVNFISRLLFLNKSKAIIGAGFLLVVFFLLSKKSKTILKISLLFAVFAIFAVLTFLLANLRESKLENFGFKNIPAESFLNVTLKIFGTAVLPAFLLPVFQLLCFEKIHKKSALAGFLYSVVPCFLCIVAPVALFGSSFANTQSFPFAAFVSTVSIGSLFTRLDTLFYFLCFACSLIKTAACLFISYMSLRKISALTK